MGSWLSAEEFNVKVSYNFILLCQWFSFPFHTVHTFISILLFIIRIQSHSFIGFQYSYLGTSNNCKTLCLQWSSYTSCPSSTYWSIWRVVISASCWWASMHPISLLFFLFLTIPFCTIYTNIHVGNVDTLKFLGLPSCCYWVLRYICFSQGTDS